MNYLGLCKTQFKMLYLQIWVKALSFSRRGYKHHHVQKGVQCLVNIGSIDWGFYKVNKSIHYTDVDNLFLFMFVGMHLKNRN